MTRAGIALGAAAALTAGADLAHKAAAPSQFLHARSVGYVVFALVLGGAWTAAIVATRSMPMALGGGLLAGGVVGNVVSLAFWPGVPNPIVRGPIAFNLADVFVVGGFVAVAGAALAIVVREPERLRQPVRLR